MRPEWLDDAIKRLAPKTERDKDKADRVRLQAALKSDRKADRDAAMAEVAEKVKPKPPKKK